MQIVRHATPPKGVSQFKLGPCFCHSDPPVTTADTSYAKNMKNTRTTSLEPTTGSQSLELRNWDHADCTACNSPKRGVSIQTGTMLLPFRSS